MSRRTRLAYQLLYGPNPPISLQSNQRFTVPPLSLIYLSLSAVHVHPNRPSGPLFFLTIGILIVKPLHLGHLADAFIQSDL